jgi:hypothetical protein
MPRSTTFHQRVGYHWPCVALAALLTDDICQEEHTDTHTVSLREEASYQGLTYIQVLKHLDNTDLYLARVAWSPLLLNESDLQAYFTEEQLFYTLPVDVRLQQKRPEDIISAIRAHAATLLPIRMLATGRQETPSEATALTLHPLAETIEVTREDLTVAMQAAVVADQEATQTTHTSPTRAAHLLQQALLRAALDALMRQLWQTPGRARSRIAQARCRLLAALLRWQEETRQRVAMARAIWKQSLGNVVWELTVGVPVLHK